MPAVRLSWSDCFFYFELGLVVAQDSFDVTQVRKPYYNYRYYAEYSEDNAVGAKDERVCEYCYEDRKRNVAAYRECGKEDSKAYQHSPWLHRCKDAAQDRYSLSSLEIEEDRKDVSQHRREPES